MVEREDEQQEHRLLKNSQSQARIYADSLLKLKVEANTALSSTNNPPERVTHLAINDVGQVVKDIIRGEPSGLTASIDKLIVLSEKVRKEVEHTGKKWAMNCLAWAKIFEDVVTAYPEEATKKGFIKTKVIEMLKECNMESETAYTKYRHYQRMYQYGMFLNSVATAMDMDVFDVVLRYKTPKTLCELSNDIKNGILKNIRERVNTASIIEITQSQE